VQIISPYRNKIVVYKFDCEVQKGTDFRMALTMYLGAYKSWQAPGIVCSVECTQGDLFLKIKSSIYLLVHGNDEHRSGISGDLMEQFRGMTGRYVAIMSSGRRVGNLFNKAFWYAATHWIGTHDDVSAQWKNVIY